MKVKLYAELPKTGVYLDEYGIPQKLFVFYRAPSPDPDYVRLMFEVDIPDHLIRVADHVSAAKAVEL